MLSERGLPVEYWVQDGSHCEALPGGSPELSFLGYTKGNWPRLACLYLISRRPLLVRNAGIRGRE